MTIERRETSPEKVAGNILALLKINGFTQRYAQRKCGFSTAFFSELKRRDSKHYPDTQNLLKLCDLFGIKIEEMLYVDYVSVADSKRIREIGPADRGGHGAMTEREKRIKELEQEEKTIIKAVIETERNLSQLSLLLDYLKTRHTGIVTELVSLGKRNILDILKDGAKDL